MQLRNRTYPIYSITISILDKTFEKQCDIIKVSRFSAGRQTWNSELKLRPTLGNRDFVTVTSSENNSISSRHHFRLTLGTKSHKKAFIGF